MEESLSSVKDIVSTYIHFQDGGRADTVPVSDSFWQELACGKLSRLEQGRLMTAFSFSEPWSSWERHPAGEELVMLLSGSATLVLEESGHQRTGQLSRPGSYVLVPKNTWHRAETTEPTTMLFLTAGAGTEHRAAGTQ